MDIIGILLFALSIVFFLFGLSQFFGLGWAMLIIDFLTQTSVSSDYSESQKNKLPAKTAKGKVIGALLIGLAILCMYLVFVI